MLLLGFDNAANSACLLPDRFELSLQNDFVCSCLLHLSFT
jgi:hypothetical protein